jgi:hypothetical protein
MSRPQCTVCGATGIPGGQTGPRTLPRVRLDLRDQEDSSAQSKVQTPVQDEDDLSPTTG